MKSQYNIYLQDSGVYSSFAASVNCLATVYSTPEACLKLQCISSAFSQRLCTYHTNSGKTKKTWGRRSIICQRPACHLPITEQNGILEWQRLNKKSRGVSGQVNMHRPIAEFQAICNLWPKRDIAHLSQFKLLWRVGLMKYGASSYDSVVTLYKP